jgi:release factor glutamine methyltransferase
VVRVGVMNADRLTEEARRTLVAVNERFGWQGDEEDQAWDLLVHVWGREPGLDDEVPPDIERKFDKLVQRRTTGEPMAFIVGWVEFLDFKLDLKPGAFIPRLTTEFLAQQAIRRLRRRRNPVHVDLATGIGPVPIGVARGVPKATVYGLDISRKAVNQARANAARLALSNVTFLRSDMFGSLPKNLRGEVDVITIHPPYVPRNEISDLPVEIKGFEPRHTLTDKSSDGLGLVRRVVDEGRDWLRPGGWLLIEIVAAEFRRIAKLLREAGYADIKSTHGELKLTRVITGRIP